MDLQALSEHLRPWWVVWLLILFVGMVAWVYRSKGKKRYEDAANIPLKDENGG